jgi:hypothetical protein
MGKKIAMSVISNYELAKELSGDKIGYAKKVISVRYNKGTPEEIPAALALAKIYHEKGSEAAVPELKGMARTEKIAKATRIERMQSKPDFKDLILSHNAEGPHNSCFYTRTSEYSSQIRTHRCLSVCARHRDHSHPLLGMAVTITVDIRVCKARIAYDHASCTIYGFFAQYDRAACGGVTGKIVSVTLAAFYANEDSLFRRQTGIAANICYFFSISLTSYSLGQFLPVRYIFPVFLS